MPKYQIGTILQLSLHIVVEIVKFDSFSSTPHYGVRTEHIIDPEEGGTPDNSTFSYGWMPVNVLDNLAILAVLKD